MTETNSLNEVRAALSDRYGIGGEFVSAPVLARILGIGRTTIHEHVKAGTFMIPHRLVLRKPLFKLDDVAAWVAAGELAKPRDLAPSTASDPASSEAIPVRRPLDDAFDAACRSVASQASREARRHAS